MNRQITTNLPFLSPENMDRLGVSRDGRPDLGLEFSDVFLFSSLPGHTNLIEHQIKTPGAQVQRVSLVD